jgi:predicted kinase
MDDDFLEMRRFRGRTIAAADDDAITEFCRGALMRLAPLLRQRVAAGRVRDGHGDLHAEHVCLTEPLVIFDCIEFNPAFRYRDVAAEVAFLAMDLEFRGYPDLSRLFVDGYAGAADDPDIVRLVPFLKAHRAYIRGKVDSLTADETEVGDVERRAAADRAHRHFELAYRYTWTDVRCLVVVVGLSGSGKSTVARALHARTGFAHLSSDVIRKELAGIPLTSRAGANDETGLYAPQQSARTYARMLALADAELQAGRGAIVDATFLRRVDREAVRDIAAARGAPVLFVECECDEQEARRRLRLRQAVDADPSDADERVYARQRLEYESFDATERAQRLGVDTTQDAAVVSTLIEAEMRRRCG